MWIVKVDQVRELPCPAPSEMPEAQNLGQGIIYSFQFAVLLCMKHMLQRFFKVMVNQPFAISTLPAMHAYILSIALAATLAA